MSGAAPVIAWQPDAPADFRTRVPEDWRGEVVRLLVALKREPRLGDLLEVDPRVGDLSDCRKLEFGPDEGRGPTFRIVYRLLPDSLAPAQVEIVAIGPKQELLAYALAASRLGRHPPG